MTTEWQVEDCTLSVTLSRPAPDVLEDTRDSIDHADHNNLEYFAEELNPSPESDSSHYYLIVDGKKPGQARISRAISWWI